MHVLHISVQSLLGDTIIILKHDNILLINDNKLSKLRHWLEFALVAFAVLQKSHSAQIYLL